MIEIIGLCGMLRICLAGPGSRKEGVFCNKPEAGEGKGAKDLAIDSWIV